jgi:hypothetical protein
MLGQDTTSVISAGVAKGASGSSSGIADAELTWTSYSCRIFLLPNDTILTATQDVGKVSTKSDSREIVYPQVKKVAGKFYDNFHEKGFPNLPANKSRTTDVITKMIINMLKHNNKASVREDFCGVSPLQTVKKST